MSRLDAVRSRGIGLAKRAYLEVVQRRSTVRVHEATWPAPSVEVHFLLGLFRSGTTPLRYSLGMHPTVATPPESEFLVPFLSHQRDLRSQQGLESMGFSRDHVNQLYRQSAGYFFGNYAASLDKAGVNVLVDKSPSYVQYAEELADLFPESKFVTLVRHPFGQIGSATSYGSVVPGIPDFPELASTYWNERTSTLLALPNSLMVRYEDLCVAPNRELERVRRHLDLPESDAIFSYDGLTADRGKEGAKALAHTSFEAEMAEPQRGWRDDQRSLEQVWSQTAAVAEGLGYGFASF